MTYNVSPNNAAPRNAKNESFFLRCGSLNDHFCSFQLRECRCFGVLGEGASPSVVLCGAIPQRTSEASVRDEADFHNLENLLPSIDCRK